MRIVLAAMGIVIAILNCSCGNSTDSQQKQSEIETCGGLIQPLDLFTEVRIEMTPETPTVGEIVTFKAISIPIDDFSKANHPSLHRLYNDSPAFSITTYPYYFRMVLDGACTDSNVMSVVSEQKEAKYLIHDFGGGFSVEAHNLYFSTKGDTIAVKMKFSNPGAYYYSCSYRIMRLPGLMYNVEQYMASIRNQRFVVREH